MGKDYWAKLDAQLCSMLWHSFKPKLLTLFQSCKTCYEVWAKAKNLYPNDIPRIYKVVSSLVHLWQNQQDMSSHLEKQMEKFFMVLSLIGLRKNLALMRDHILTSPTIPTLDDGEKDKEAPSFSFSTKNTSEGEGTFGHGILNFEALIS
ncbi:hypothetical protein V6Z11_D01G099600 [Gossypium hirsutum]